MTEIPDMMVQTLKAKGFDKDQINEVAHAINTFNKAQEGPPLKTIMIGDDGFVYVRVALPDPTFGPIHHWRVIDVDNGDANTFSAETVVSGRSIYQPE